MFVFGKSDIGLQRSSNQDEYRIGNLEDGIAFGLVCDGMGGENGGNIASEIACDVIHASLTRQLRPGLTAEDYKNMIITAVSEGNMAVYEKSKSSEDYAGMGTTVVLAVTVDGQAYIAHVGDSRIYMIRNGKMTQITKDHSVVQTLLEEGKITPEEIHTHPQKNMITRAVGIGYFVDIDYIEVEDVEDAIFLLCSDGLTNTCDDETIKEIILSSKMEEICMNLITCANESGGFDNITAVVML